MRAKWLIATAAHAAFVTGVAFAAVAIAETPLAVAARTALADLEAQPAATRAHVRYLLLNDQAEERIRETVAISYLLNAISRSRSIARPQEIASGKLLRVDLAAYANPREPATLQEILAAWEKLVEVDPYFHLRTQVVAPPVARANKDARQTSAAKVVTTTVDAGWISLEVAARLKSASGSAGAVLRGDYFIARAAQAPHYYQLAGVPRTEGELLARLGVDRQAIDRLAADAAANLFISRVTTKPRRLIRLPGPLGGTWLTRDVEVETPDRDPLRNPIDFTGPAGAQRLRYDASEWFAQKENKFWVTAVFDAAGHRQDAVKDTIAKDSLAHDGIVRPLVSCIRCHELGGGQAGMQPFTDDQFPLLSGEAAILRSYLPQVAQRVAELYDPVRLAREQTRDREDYSAAVLQATGVSPREAAEALVRTYSDFVDRPVTRAVAARECGLHEPQFLIATRHATDPAILALRAGGEIRRTSYEASFPELMFLTVAKGKGTEPHEN